MKVRGGSAESSFPFVKRMLRFGLFLGEYKDTGGTWVKPRVRDVSEVRGRQCACGSERSGRGAGREVLARTSLQGKSLLDAEAKLRCQVSGQQEDKVLAG